MWTFFIAFCPSSEKDHADEVSLLMQSVLRKMSVLQGKILKFTVHLKLLTDKPVSAFSGPRTLHIHTL